MSQNIKLSVLQRVDGSCMIETADTDIIASVTGPIESRARQEIPQKVALEICITPAVGPSATREKLLEDKLKSILNSGVIDTYAYPRQLLQIVIQVLKNQNILIRDLMYIINSSYLALIDSGVPLKKSWWATCCIIGPDSNEEQFEFDKAAFENSSASFLVAFELEDGKCKNLVLLESNGDNLTQSLIEKVIQTSKAHIENTIERVRETINAKVTNDYIWKQ